MAESVRKKYLKRVETGLLVTGTSLLAAFFFVRAWSDSSSAAGIEAFEQARQSLAELGGSQELLVSAAGPAQFNGERISSPDFALWSEKRIREYRESVAASTDLPLAVLAIERLGLEVPVYNGASDFNLNRGVARIKGTAQVNAPGNLGIAGHRDGFFRGLKNLALGDQLVVETLAGAASYRVTSIEIVDPSDVWVLAPTEADTVTLVTCYPFYFVGNAPQRYIVTAQAETVQVRSYKEET